MAKKKASRSRLRMLRMGGVEHSLTAWAREHGMDPNVLRLRLNRGWSLKEALKTPIADTAGDNHCRARMTVKKVKEARRLYAYGQESIRVLAERYGVTHGTIWSLIHRKTWSHVK